jgi:hypothetical protein
MKARPLKPRQISDKNIIYFVMDGDYMLIRSHLKEKISYAAYQKQIDDYFSKVGLFISKEGGPYVKISEPDARKLAPHLFK